MRCSEFFTRLSILAVLTTATAANAQLQITEILYDSATSPETNWEWFEIYNGGDTEVDLDGYVLDDRSTSAALTGPNILSFVGDAEVNTIVPPQTAAVVYNASGLDFDESRFRTSWNLGGNVPLIGVDRWQSLNNSGDAFGLWTDIESYQGDVDNVDEDEDLELATFNNAVAWVDYSAEGFPDAGNASIHWNGQGDILAGENWAPTTAEIPGVVTSIETLLPTSPLNDLRDVGNPGVVLGDGAVDSLIVTEIMYNPASSPDGVGEWEWVEVWNGTDETIDFAATPYVFDDLADNALTEANVAEGSIEAGQVAILYKSTVDEANLAKAWGEELNLIPVDRWSALNSGGDTVGLWDSLEAYALDNPEEGDRTFDEAVFSASYVDGADGWPNVSNGQSISLVDLEGDTYDGANWILSVDGDGTSRIPEPVLSSELIDHAGGDLGTPGTFGEVDPPSGLDLNSDGSIDTADAALICSTSTDVEANGGVLADFNLSGEVDFSDFLILSTSFGAVGDDANYSTGDANCNGEVDFSDFLVLSTNFGQTAAGAASVPEPGGRTLLLICGIVGLITNRRRRR